ncbi:MAG: hypothetical protein H3C30_08940 [Candidatus Hydrogenedentes bacterium]|nr:hypothetical protein [Candidatus Hydrogenedentota bacterium]
MEKKEAQSCCGPENGACDCVGELRRREFLKVAGLGLVATTLGGRSVSAMAGPFSEKDTVAGHLIPADKKLSAAWLKSLFERGEKEVFTGAALEKIGMPCGGIGTGQLYLCGDGTLGCWQIFNDAQSNWVEGTFATYAHKGIAKPVKQGFAVEEIGGDGVSSVRLLTKDHFFNQVSFSGEYPIGTIRYRSGDWCPISVTMEAFSPFIPLNAKDSALPGTLFHITVKNESSKGRYVSIAGWLENSVCRHYVLENEAVRKTAYVAGEKHALCLHSAMAAPDAPVNIPRETILFEDFEKDGFGAWTVEGDAFGAGPLEASSDKHPVTGFERQRYAASSAKGDMPQGTLTSPVFTISRKHVNFLFAGGFHSGMTCVSLLVDGKEVRSSAGRNSAEMEWRSWRVDRWEGREAQLVIRDRWSMDWGRVAVDQIEFSDVLRGNGPTPVTEAPDFGTMALACLDPDPTGNSPGGLLPKYVPDLAHVPLEGAEYPVTDSHCGLLRTAKKELAPGESHTFTFMLAWHFPNQFVGDKFDPAVWKGGPKRVGHEYAARFADAAAVAEYLVEHHDRLTAQTRLWRDAYYDSTLPYWLLDRLHATLSCLATGTCQWWENGRFWAYEGVACCHGNCTHVWNYAHAHARLFPEIARNVREMQDFNPRENGGGFNPETGLVGFRGDDNYAADGQCGTILKAYREHLMSPDDGFLKKNWASIKKAMEYSITRDRNADGLIEDIQHNTYDINYHGANTFVGSLYLAALRASEEMALEMGDRAFAKRVRSIFKKGAALTDKRLWNGEYYVQDVDLKKYPKHQYKDGCLSDQVFGQGWAHQVGLGYLYPPDKVGQTLDSVWKYNWAPDVGPYNEKHRPFRWFVTPGQAGLITCTWPRGGYLAEGTLYREEVWTGIEYQVAGHMIWEGKLTEGLAICRAVHDRYHPEIFNPYNEVECGDHYARALASWGVYLALAGFEYHGPRGWLGFAPRITPEKFSALVTTAEGWVTLSQEREGKRQVNRVTVRHGSLRLTRLTMEATKAVKSVRVTIQGEPVKAHTRTRKGTVEIAFSEVIHMEAGELLEAVLEG